MIVEIDNKLVTAARGGYAFLSYQVNSTAGDESLRQFCYIGLRSASRLPVVQVLQSHGLEIVKAEVQQHVNVVAAAYQAIQEGDSAELTVRRFRSNGTELSPFVTQLISQQKFDGAPLEWQIPKAQLNTLDTGGICKLVIR